MRSSPSSLSRLWRCFLRPFTVLQKYVLKYKYPSECDYEHCSPHYFLLELRSSLFHCKQLLVWVTFLLFLIKFVFFVHASHLFLVPDSLIVVYFELWMSWTEPPKVVNPKQSLCTIKEILLLPILFLLLVYKTLVVIDGVDSLL